MRRAASALAGLVLVLLLGACADTPERTGDRFVDLYFVEIDQARARALTTGLASKKLDEELHLVESIRRSYQADQAKPSVFYARRELRVEGERARALYDVTVRFGRDEARKRVMLSLEHAEEAGRARWKVGNYLVTDGAPSAPR